MNSAISEKTSSRRYSSILKAQKPCEHLQNVEMSPSSTEKNPTASLVKFKRRVSFAEKKHVKEFCDSVEQGTVWDNTYEQSELSQIRNSQHSNNNENAFGNEQANDRYNGQVDMHPKSINNLKIGDLYFTPDESQNTPELKCDFSDIHAQFVKTENATTNANYESIRMGCDSGMSDAVDTAALIERSHITTFEDVSSDKTPEALNEITSFSQIQRSLHMAEDSPLQCKEKKTFFNKTVEVTDDLPINQSISEQSFNEFDLNKPNLLPEETLIFLNQSMDCTEVIQNIASIESPQKAIFEKTTVVSYDTTVDCTGILQKVRKIEKSLNPSPDESIKKVTLENTMFQQTSVDSIGIVSDIRNIENSVLENSENHHEPNITITFPDDSLELTDAVLSIPSTLELTGTTEEFSKRRLSSAKRISGIRVDFNDDDDQQQPMDASIMFNDSMDITRVQPSMLQANKYEAEKIDRTMIFDDNSIECTEAVLGVPVGVLLPYPRENCLSDCRAAINCTPMNSSTVGGKNLVFGDDSMELTRAVQFPLQSIKDNRIGEKEVKQHWFDDTARFVKDGRTIVFHDDSMEITKTVQCSSQLNISPVLEKEKCPIQIENHLQSRNYTVHEDNRIKVPQNNLIKVIKSKTRVSLEDYKKNGGSSESVEQHCTDYFESEDIIGVPLLFLENENGESKTRDSQSSEKDSQTITFRSEEMEFTEPISMLFPKLIPSIDNDTSEPVDVNTEIKNYPGHSLLPHATKFNWETSLTRQAILKDDGKNFMTNDDFNSEILSGKMELKGVNHYNSEKSNCGQTSSGTRSLEIPRNDSKIFFELRIMENEDTSIIRSANFPLMIDRGIYDESMEELRYGAYLVRKFQPKVARFEPTKRINTAQLENLYQSVKMSNIQGKKVISFVFADTIKCECQNSASKRRTVLPNILQYMKSLSHISPCLVPNISRITITQDIDDGKNANDTKGANLENRMKRKEIHVSLPYLGENWCDAMILSTFLPAGRDGETVDNVKNHRHPNIDQAGENSSQSPQGFFEKLCRRAMDTSTKYRSSNALISIQTAKSWNNKNVMSMTHSGDEFQQQLIFQDTHSSSVTMENYLSDELLSTIVFDKGQTLNQLGSMEKENQANEPITSLGITAHKSSFCIFKETIENLSKRSDTIWNINRLDEKIVAFNFFSKSIVLVIYLNKISTPSIADPIKDIALLSQLVEEETDPGVILAHSLIMKNIDVATLRQSYRTYEEMPHLLEFVSTKVKLGMNFAFELEHLRNHNVMEIHKNRITFIARTRHINAGIILKITMEMKPFEEIRYSDITVLCLLGSELIRKMDIQKLITNVKRDHRFLRLYMIDVANYIDLMAKTDSSTL